MSTDIHGVFQRKLKAAGWETIPSNYKEGRHYQLFAALANVRNGYGFAGIPTGEAIAPISEPRGYPRDFVVDGDIHIALSLAIVGVNAPPAKFEVWMGDHSHSWLSGAEMLEWFASAPIVEKTGVISREQYAACDKESRPETYCGGVSGRGIVVIEDNAISRAKPDWTHIRVTWQQYLAEELAYFFDEVRRLQKEHGKIRFVFGFDS